MLSILSLLLFAPPAPANGLEGMWVTKDKSTIQVMPCASGASGLCLRIVGFGDPNAPRTDTKNPDDSLKKRKLCGLQIGMGFLPEGEEAKDGKLYDPESGHSYSGSMKLDGQDTLKLHGFIGISVLGRTETWHRTTGKIMSCKDLPNAT